MAKIKVAIYDVDKEYRERFADYLMSYKSEEMELSVFTGENYFFDALGVDKYHLIVLGGGYEEVLAKAKSVRVPVLVLTEYMQSYVKETVEMGDEQIVFTSKYQSMDIITKQMQLMAGVKGIHRIPTLASRELDVVGVFSPVKHEMQMMFSLLYAKNAARDRKVLYINLLDFSGFSEIYGEREYDLGDAILQIREEDFKVEQLLASIYEMEEFSYITPFFNPENVREVTGADVRRLLEILAEHTDYRTIILDVGMNVNGLAEILLACSRIYCLEKKGYLFEVQMQQFFSYLEKLVDDAFLRRIEIIDLPYQAKGIGGGVNLLERLNWSEFGDFIRSKL